MVKKHKLLEGTYIKFNGFLLVLTLISTVFMIPLGKAQSTITVTPSENHHIPTIVPGNSTDSNETALGNSTASTVLNSTDSDYLNNKPYVAGWMDAGDVFGTAQTRVTVSFPNTDPSVIQEDNWLAGGMFVVVYDSTVPQTDYAFYTILVLDHYGGLYLDVGFYETYEALFNPTNPYPRGLFPWEELRYGSTWSIGGVSPSTPITLTARWDAPSGLVYWDYQVPGSDPITICHCDVAALFPTIHRHFSVGTQALNVLGCPWAFPYWMTYCFQFGVMSNYNLGHGGWNVKLENPQYYTNFYSHFYTYEWHNVNIAKSIGGGNSYLDARWRWGGEPYCGVDAYYYYNQPSLGPYTIIFYYSGSTLSDHTLLWGDDVSLVWLTPWMDLTEREYWDKVIARYKETGIEIQRQSVWSSDALYEEIRWRHMFGNDPDIISMPAMWLPEFANWKTPILAEPPSWVQAYVKSNWIQAAIDSVTWKSFVWGYPSEYGSWALVYNRKLFNDKINSLPSGHADRVFLEGVLAKLEADTPLRWDLTATSEFTKAAILLTIWSVDEVTQTGFCPMITYGSEEEHYQFLSLLWSNGGEYLNLTTPEPLFNSTKGVEVMQLYYNLGFVYGTYNPLDLPDYEWSAWEDETIAMIIFPTWMRYIRDAMEENFNNLGVAPIPIGPSGSTPVSAVYNWLTGVSQKAKNEGRADAAWSFLTWLTTPLPAESIDLGVPEIGKIPKGNNVSIMGDFLIYDNRLPSRTSDQQNGQLSVGGAPGPLIKDDFWFKGFMDIGAKYGKLDKPFLTSYKAQCEIGTMFEKVVTVGIDAATAMRDAAAEIAAILPIAGDVNINGIVDIYDAVILISDWFATPTGPYWYKWNRGRSDCNDNNYAGLDDALVIVDNYEKTWRP